MWIQGLRIVLTSCCLASALVGASIVIVALADPPQALAASEQQHEAATFEQGMQAMMRAATPGEPHELLAAMEGDWAVRGKAFDGSSGEAMPIEGEAQLRMLLDGRYLQQIYRGSFMGQPFEGRGIEGFDNVSGSFFSVWFDSMGTGLLIEKGKRDGDRRAIDFMGTRMDPVSGTEIVEKSRVELHSDDHFRLQMWDRQGDGTFALVMELDYRRKG